MMTVAELKKLPQGSATAFEALVVLRKVSTRKTKTGGEFLVVEVGDRTGSFTFNCFEDSAAFAWFQNSREGSVLRLQGVSGHYQDRFSPKIGQAEVVPEDQLGDRLEHLVEVSPCDPEALWAEVRDALAQIRREALRQTVAHALAEIEPAFRSSPAAIAMHHAYRHGLLEHTVRMTRAARALLPLYPEVDPDLALAGVLLHDIGKTVEYTGALAPRRGRTGILQGHVVLGYRMARRAAMLAKLEPDLQERLEHVILSHQGELQWGAAALAATPEAVFVSMIDNLDAKMGMVQRALRGAASGDEFSDFLPGLQTHLLLTPPPELPPDPPPAEPAPAPAGS